MPRKPPRPRRVCFVTGTRAEFGLMRGTLAAIRGHPNLQLQIVVTGMHLDETRGRTLQNISDAGMRVDRIVPWPASRSPSELSARTGEAMAGIAKVISNLKSEIILIVGDRVEAFAAAAAAHIAGCVVAHVHGGDRALGQVDDSLRHAITKLAHVHFPATRQSARRIARLGEDRWRIHNVGSPAVDDAAALAAHARVKKSVRREALIVLHPVDPDVDEEYRRACMVLRAVQSIGFDRIIIIHPNTDSGAEGIVRCWKRHARGPGFEVFLSLPRPQFLESLGRAAVLVGNSSSGIIEAASFGTPVVDVGSRQLGRERSGNVTNVPYSEEQIRRILVRIWNDGRPRRFRGRQVYGGEGAAGKIARVLATLPLDTRTRRKLIAY